jgi:hypothetical protein
MRVRRGFIPSRLVTRGYGGPATQIVTSGFNIIPIFVEIIQKGGSKVKKIIEPIAMTTKEFMVRAAMVAINDADMAFPQVGQERREFSDSQAKVNARFFSIRTARAAVNEIVIKAKKMTQRVI